MRQRSTGRPAPFHLRRGRADAGWAVGLRHGTGRLRAEERWRVGLCLREELLRGTRLASLERTFALWQRLPLCAELAGLGSSLVRGPVQRKETTLLPLSPRRAEAGFAAWLERHGFHAAHGTALAALAEARSACAQLAEERRAVSDLTAVLRGDLTLLARVARRALPPEEARPLQLERLLPPGPAHRAAVP